MTVALAMVLGLVIGVTLGALGAGGSILAVPVLVHIVGLDVPVATATSLVAVGSAAVVAAGSRGHRPNVRWDITTWFVAAGTLGAIGGAAVGRRVDGDSLMVAFSVVMVFAAYRMFAGARAGARTAGVSAAKPVGAAVAGGPAVPVDDLANEDEPGRSEGGTGRNALRNALGFATAGVAVGFLTGLFGVGGGFVIVPVLALVLTLAMPKAVATSLAIVAGNALVALIVRGVESVDWGTALSFTVPMLVGSLVGAVVAKHMHPTRSRQVFAVLLVAVAIANAVSVLI